MTKSTREIVIPSQYLGETSEFKAGRGTLIDHGKIYAKILGVLNKHPPYVNVVPLKGRYDPVEGDTIIGFVEQAMSSSWLADINAPYPALLHVSEVPWRVDFGETEKYLNTGDTIMAKILSVDVERKLNITLKDRNLYKIQGGHIITVGPSKVPRIIGKKGSMINLLKKYTRCRIFVGKNGRIWIDGEDLQVSNAVQAIRLIERESISYGLTDKVEELLKSLS
ncbi:MAG: KH domain-containing protein [Candidatus Thermoplasmatota archaeon]|nr:KH domain-containing protein [Candidatus Thermoplasmatota archaeon]MBS3801242.1 KH domain-containing protein [Candidatus Thermoplasmatota archaeon]